MPRPIVVTVVLSAMLMASNVGEVGARPSIQVMTGHWAGFSRSATDPNASRNLTLEVASQSSRGFKGDLCAAVIDGCIPVKGSISASGRVDIVGERVAGGKITYAQVMALLEESISSPGGGGTTDPTPGLLGGEYQIAFADGTEDKGVLGVVQQVPDAGVPSFLGDWSGWVQADGSSERLPMAALFERDPAGRIGGHLTWGLRDLRCGPDESPDQWCNLLAVSYRSGGSGAMVLDVTDPDGAFARVVFDVGITPAGPVLVGTFRVLCNDRRCAGGAVSLTRRPPGT